MITSHTAAIGLLLVQDQLEYGAELERWELIELVNSQLRYAFRLLAAEELGQCT